MDSYRDNMHVCLKVVNLKMKVGFGDSDRFRILIFSLAKVFDAKVELYCTMKNAIIS